MEYGRSSGQLQMYLLLPDSKCQMQFVAGVGEALQQVPQQRHYLHGNDKADHPFDDDQLPVQAGEALAHGLDIAAVSFMLLRNYFRRSPRSIIR